MIRIIYYRDKCIGCNACVEAAGHRWRISRKDGKSILLGSVVKKNFHQVLTTDDEWKSNRSAAVNCPVKCIRLMGDG